MKRNMKRFISLLLAASMCLSLTLTAFATETEGTETPMQTEEVEKTTGQEETEESIQGTEEPQQVQQTEPAEEAAEQKEQTEEPQQSAEEPAKEETKNEPVTGTVTQEDNAEETKEPVQGKVQTEEPVQDDNVVVEKGDKPYLALGADLTEQQQQTVLDLMGINPADLTNYDVVYVTNDMEHQYLDAYLPASTIGTKALSSVLIMEGKKGSGIQISTKNISYCSVGMYKNALATAGLEDAEIIVAGPFPISGTAALIGALNAYSKMTGEEVQEKSLDAAMNELVVTGKLADATGGDTAEAEQFMAYLKQEVVKNGLKDEESINEVIEKGCKEFNITITDTQKKELLNALTKISELDLDWNQLFNQAADLYDQLKERGLLSEGFWDRIKSFFSSIGDFFKNLFDDK